MHLKQTGYCFSVLLIYTIATITLPPVITGYSSPNPHLAPHHGGSSAVVEGLTHRLHLDSKPGDESRNLPHFHTSGDGDGTRAETSGGPQHALKMAALPTNGNKPKRGGPPSEDCSSGKIEHVTPGSFYITGQLETSPKVGYQADSAGPAQGGQERIRGQRLGGTEESWQRLQPVVECGDDAMTLTVRRRRAVQLQLDRVNESAVPLSQLPPQCGYSVQTSWRDLSLMARYDACHVTQQDDCYELPLLWRGTPVKMSCPASQIQPQAVGPSSLCCSPYGMTVEVQGLYATEDLRVNVRGEWTPLVALAERCGYTLDRRHAEIVFVAPFITCGITVKDGRYTLSFQIEEGSFTLACPVSLPEELPLTHEPLVSSPHLTREPTEHMPQSLEPFPWAPPFYLAPPYYPHPTYHHKYPSSDGLEAHNPSTPSPSTPDPTFGPQPLRPVESQQDYQDYYPHQIPVGESYKHSSLSPTDDMEDSSRASPDLQQMQEAPVLGVSERHGAARSPSSDTGFPIQVESPPHQPPSHAFNPYYHYYHHPKIPLPGPPQDPDPGPEVLTNPHNPEYPVLPPNVQQSEALSGVDSHQFLQLEAASHPYTPPTRPPKATYTPHPPQPYPYHYSYYFPHIARGGAKRMAPLNPDTVAKTNMSDDQNSKWNTFVRPPPRSSQFHDQYDLSPYIDLQNPDTIINFQNNSPERIKYPLLSEDDYDDYDDGDVKSELDYKKRQSSPVTPAVQPPLPPAYPPEQPSFPTPSPHHNLPPSPYYYQPYYHYYQMYQMYHRPESLLGADDSVSPTSSTEASEPLLGAFSSPLQHPSYRDRQTTAPPTETVYDVPNGPLHPYYYYHHYYQPEVSVHNQELHPKSESLLPSDSDYSGMDWLVHAAEAGYPRIPQPLHNPFNSLNSHYITQQHPYDPFGHAGGEEERLEMKDPLKASPSAPSASPCGLGPVSDFDCSVSLGCCSYPVKVVKIETVQLRNDVCARVCVRAPTDCTMGQHLIFAVPDSVVEPTVAPSAHPSELSNVSCTLQKLTSDPDIYIVPLDGCGVNKHLFGQTVVHLLEVHGIHSQQDASSVLENSPVRLMVECSSSPGSPGEVRLHVMDQPPPPPFQSTPATVNVQLRIATDESFTSFHPEAHLPLSLMRGRPVNLEASLLDPPEPGLVLLVHSCLAYTQAPYTSWKLVYDGCPGRGDSQLLPSPRSYPHHIRRITISGFLSLPSESPSYMADRGSSHLEDPEIYFLCLTEVCSAADGDCTVGCINSPKGDA